MDTASLLTTLVLCGLMGVLGQGARAVVGLKSSATLAAQTPNQQSQFDAAYFALSLMIGFIAGILAGLALGLTTLADLHADPKLLLGLAAAGYAGTDFIENAFTNLIPKPVFPPSVPAASAPPAAPALAPRASAGGAPATPVAVQSAFDQALHQVAPGVDVAAWHDPLTAAFAKFEFNNDRRVAAAIGQFLAEAGASLGTLEENLNYSADRLVRVFPRKFATLEATKGYVGDKIALANYVYANIIGNGDEASGDGYRFRGRGLIQITGRANYTALGKALGKTAEDTAEYCSSKEGAAMSGCWYLWSKGCTLLADKWDIDEITKLVNAAMLQQAAREAYSAAMLKALGGTQP